jgi:hypothetical protein
VLTRADIEENFTDVVDLGEGIIRGCDEFPQRIEYNYVKLGDDASGGKDFLLVSKQNDDEDFAKRVFSCVVQPANDTDLAVCDLTENKYGLTHLLIAPKAYFSHFKGRLDNEREQLHLCVPIFRAEFSGRESVAEFFEMRRHLIDTLDWNRRFSPKIALRFDNPKTGGGTNGQALVKDDTLLREIDKLDGVAEGFIEIANYVGEVLEILSADLGTFVLIRNRDDSRRELLSQAALLEQVWLFLKK